MQNFLWSQFILLTQTRFTHVRIPPEAHKCYIPLLLQQSAIGHQRPWWWGRIEASQCWLWLQSALWICMSVDVLVSCSCAGRCSGVPNTMGKLQNNAVESNPKRIPHLYCTFHIFQISFQQIRNSMNVLSTLLSNANSWKNPGFMTDFICTESTDRPLFFSQIQLITRTTVIECAT